MTTERLNVNTGVRNYMFGLRNPVQTIDTGREEDSKREG